MVKNGREASEGAGGSGKSQEGNQDGGVHDVFAEIFLFGGEAENQEHKTKAGGNQGRVVGGARQDETGQTEQDVGEGETDGEVGHIRMVEDLWDGEKNVSGWADLAGGGKCGKIVGRRLSSVVEQRFCKPLVVGSNPTAGSNQVAG